MPVRRTARPLLAAGATGILTAALLPLAAVPTASAAVTASVSADRVVTLTEDGTPATVTVRLGVTGGARTTAPVIVTYQTLGGTATRGLDYRPVSGRLVFAAGSTDGQTASFVLPVLRSRGSEVAETVSVRLTPIGATLAGRQPRVVVNAHGLPYLDAARPVGARVRDLVSRMSLREKVGQMTQAERANIEARPDDIVRQLLGSILSGGGSTPTPNTAPAWADMVDGYQREALSTRLQIPLVYGVDSVHGHGNLVGATLFPHQIGLGATRDPRIVRRVAEVTAAETRATGIPWVFAPCLCVATDTRWGRTYESFGEDPSLVRRLETGIDGLQGTRRRDLRSPDHVLATAKHFAGDGNTAYGTGRGDYPIDQGVTQTSRRDFRRTALAPYLPAVQQHDVGSVMPSYSSVDWTEDGLGDPVAMHANRELLQGWLKDRTGFDGFVISDYNGIHQISGDPNALEPGEVVQAVNAGIDLAMEPADYARFQTYLLQAIDAGPVTHARIDDAVTRILTKKMELGLFERPFAQRGGIADIGSAAHRAVARRAVARSQVLLKNDGDVLPLARDAKVYVAGRSADDLGNQAGGWTITWQGGSGTRTTGTTVLQGIREVAPGAQVTFSADGSAPTAGSDVGVVVVGETPYSEGFGDVGGPEWAYDPSDAGVPREEKSLSLQAGDAAVVDRVCGAVPQCVVLVVSGRPQVLTAQLPRIDALVASWLPGTEGTGVADVLFGRRPFTGQLPQTWPRSADQEPINVGDATYAPLYPFGWGLSTDRAGGSSSAGAAEARALADRARGVTPRLVQRVRLLVQEAVADPASGVPARAADRIARADRALLRGEPDRALRLLLQALG